jgi:hypothetical protein
MAVHVIVEGTIVSCRPVPMRLQLVWCRSGPSNGGEQKSMIFGESTSRKLLALGVIPGDGTEVRGGIHMNRGRVGEERGGKETDRCPLTLLVCILVQLVYVRSHYLSAVSWWWSIFIVSHCLHHQMVLPSPALLYPGDPHPSPSHLLHLPSLHQHWGIQKKSGGQCLSSIRHDTG